MSHPAKVSAMLAVTLIAALAAPALGSVVYVRCGASGSPDGESWATAYPTIGQGIGAASEGDQVWVAGGSTYVESVTLKPGVALYGGFPAAGGGWQSRQPTVHRTIIDGSQSGAVVVVPAGATSTTVIDGFTIRNGKAATGGGINCATGALPTISNNVIEGNTATNHGGGIYGGGVISHNMITGNVTANSGGGIFCGTTSAIISDNTITENRAAWGGGIRYHSSTGEICRNVILRNTGTAGAGGVNINSASPLVVSNVIAGNQSPSTAGGLDVNNSSSLVCNNTLVENRAAQGGGIAIRGSGNPTVRNNIVAFNATGVYKLSTGQPVFGCNCVYQNTGYDYSGVGAGIGDVSQDPAFVDRANGNYHLTNASPCRDRGDSLVLDAAWVDIDAEPRVFPPKVDIGADEVHQYAALSTAKREADGCWITALDIVVTAAWPGHFYAETADRTCGMRVELLDHGVAVGDVVVVSGRVMTNPEMERYVLATAVLRRGTGAVAPLGLTNAALGGGDWGSEAARQCGIAGSRGLNNIGLLVKTWGRVTGRGRDWFYIDDGSRVTDGTPYKGICVRAPGLSIPTAGTWVQVTGISGCDAFSGRVVNLLLPRGQDDILAIPPD